MTTSRQKANNKYNVKAYKQYSMRLRPEIYQQIEELREDLKLSKPELIKLLIETYKQGYIKQLIRADLNKEGKKDV